MNYELPKQSLASLIFQCVCVILFAASLYFCISAYNTTKNYDVAIAKLQKKKRNLQRASSKVEEYLQFVQKSPHYKTLLEPQWEKVDEVWVDLSYQTLLQRLTELYREDRPFVLDYFGARLDSGDSGDPERTSTPQRRNSQTTEEESQSKKLIFNLQGYFLCPCQ